MKAIKNSILWGALASSWDRTGLLPDLLVDYYLPEIGDLRPPEIDELCWTIPVRAGDELSARVTVTEALRSGTEPDFGIVHSSVEILNRDRKEVMSMKMLHTGMAMGPGIDNLIIWGIHWHIHITGTVYHVILRGNDGRHP